MCQNPYRKSYSQIHQFQSKKFIQKMLLKRWQRFLYRFIYFSIASANDNIWNNINIHSKRFCNQSVFICSFPNDVVEKTFWLPEKYLRALFKVCDYKSVKLSMYLYTPIHTQRKDWEVLYKPVKSSYQWVIWWWAIFSSSFPFLCMSSFFLQSTVLLL